MASAAETPRETVGHDGNERTIAGTFDGVCRDRPQEAPALGGGKHAQDGSAGDVADKKPAEATKCSLYSVIKEFPDLSIVGTG